MSASVGGGVRRSLDMARTVRTPALVVLATLALLPAAASSGAAAPGGCGERLFPRSNYWNADVTSLPVHRNSDRIIATMGVEENLHPDFGSGLWDGGPIGIPFDVVAGDQPTRRVSFYYPDESDGRRYPLPEEPSIEGGPDADGDRHVLLWQQESCRLWELFDAHPNPNGTWRAGSGAIWDLDSNALRPAGWTSADAAGLPILAGLVRYDEVAAGEIGHAIRMTAPQTRGTYVWPARHEASDLSGGRYPAMGQWLRLRADVDPNDFPPQARVVVRALQVHGAIIADNGSALFISGSPDERWDNDDLAALKSLTGADFEVVQSRRMMVDPDSAKLKRRYRVGA